MRFEVISSALLGLAAMLFFLATRMRSVSPVVQRMLVGSMLAPQPIRTPTLPREQLRRAATEALGRVGKALGGQGQQMTDLSRQLRWAGITLSPEAWSVLPLFTAVLGLVFGALVGLLHPGVELFTILLGAVVGAAAPRLLLRQRLSARKARIAADILSYTEYLAMATQAGADFRTAIRQVVSRFPSPVSEAFVAAVQTAGVGGRIDDGLRAAQAELDNPDADAIIEALLRQNQWGSEVAEMLLDAVAAIRKERVEKVVEKASRSSLLLLVPMLVFELPVVFALVIWPLLQQALHTLGAV